MIEHTYYTNKEIDEQFKRSGSCDYKKCKAACCRFLLVGSLNSAQQEKYFKGFKEIKLITFKGIRKIVINSTCKYLNLKTYECKRQKTKPACCRQFPIPTDGVYKLIQPKCSYKFKEKALEKMGLD